ncbi:MAG: HTH-type transcriptional regulator CysB [Gammaproteobacteria bacterium]|nr:HTH-type transcriptional regulator CysB [Gammaproteobacteria bacterium]
MKLQQLRYVWEIANHDLNVSATAESLYTSQPGISKQVRMLEDELGVQIFARNGKRLTHMTAAGEAIVQMARDVLYDVENIKRVAEEYSNERRGSLSMATTHTQARYALPPVIEAFRAEYPEVALHMNQGTPEQIARLAETGEVEFAIATEGLEHFNNLIMMPCYRWTRTVVVPNDHPLASKRSITLRDVADQPLVTYVFGFTGHSRLDEAFLAAGYEPNIVFTATDTDVIKTYVRLGLGIGIIATMAYDPEQDSDLTAIDASHLFRPSVTYIGCRKGTFMRRFMLDFVSLFAGHLTDELVRAALVTSNKTRREALFKDVELPVR